MADKSIVKGESAVARVVGFDQYGNPFPLDLAATPAQWSTDQASNIGLAPGDTPDAELVTGLEVTSGATLAVQVGTLTATAKVDVTLAPAVLTSIAIQFG